VEVLDRVKVIPEEVLAEWMRQEPQKLQKAVGGPWEYFDGVDLDGAHIAIDEAHHFVPNTTQVFTRKAWLAWLSEIRHQGCTVEFITQRVDKMDQMCVKEAQIRYLIFNGEESRDPFCKIRMRDWFELRAGMFGIPYQTAIVQTEQVMRNGQWVETDSIVRYPDPDLYALYNSYSKPHKGGKGANGPQRMHETLTRPRLLLWFLRENFGRLFRRTVVIGVLVWICFFGGFEFLFNGFREYLFAATVGDEGDVRNVASAASKESTSSGEVDEDAVEDSVEVTPQTVLFETDMQGEGRRQWTIEQVHELLEEREASRERERELSGEVEEVRVAGDKGLMLLPDEVVMSTGQRLVVGDTMKGNSHEGKTVIAIDFERRGIQLDDGSVLRVGGVSEFKEPAVRRVESDVEGAVSRGGSREREEAERSGRRPEYIDSGVRDAVERVPAVPERTIRRLNSVGGGDRPTVGVD